LFPHRGHRTEKPGTRPFLLSTVPHFVLPPTRQGGPTEAVSHPSLRYPLIMLLFRFALDEVVFPSAAGGHTCGNFLNGQTPCSLTPDSQDFLAALCPNLPPPQHLRHSSFGDCISPGLRQLFSLPIDNVLPPGSSLLGGHAVDLDLDFMHVKWRCRGGAILEWCLERFLPYLDVSISVPPVICSHEPLVLRLSELRILSSEGRVIQSKRP